MPFFPRTEKEIVTDSLQRLSQNTNITQLSPGGKARFFIATVATEQERQHETFDTNLLQPFIKYAENKFLDFFGDMLNLPRVEATHAEALNNNMMFYVSTGTFGDINAGSSFTIPSGTSVFTKQLDVEVITPGIAEQPVINFTTLQDAVCEASNSFVYVPIRASVEGSESSVPRNVLNEHNFSTYTLSTNNLLKCTNRFAIDNGVDREESDSYRYRLSNVFAARSQAVKAAIRLSALSVPGVADILEVAHEQGPGTGTIYVRSIAPTTSPDLITAVSNNIELVAGFGNRMFVMAAKNIGVEFIASVAWSPRATSEEIASGYRTMRDAVENQINSLDIGESLLLTDVIDVMLSAAPKASYIGRNTPNKFEEVYIYRQSPIANDNGLSRSLLISDSIQPLYNERIILETSSRYRGIQFITI